MKKIAILGCENSHADAFLKLIKDGVYNDIEVIGVYSDDEQAQKRMRDNFGVHIAKSYDEFVGKVDGILITARHGDNHLKYALPYIESDIPMFIDKPITASVDEALTLAKLLKKNNVRYSGGSSCALCPEVLRVKAVVDSKEKGKLLGGFLRAPISLKNEYGNFWFYSQHLVQIMQTVFGYYPEAVNVRHIGETVDVMFEYSEFDVMGSFVDGNYKYYLSASLGEDVVGTDISVTEAIYVNEFEEFYKLLNGAESVQTLTDFISPVYIIDAIIRSINTGTRQQIIYPKEEDISNG